MTSAAHAPSGHSPSPASNVPEYVRAGLTGMRLVVGSAAILSPRLTSRVFGVDPARNPGLLRLGRLMGARDLALAAGLLQLRGEALDRCLHLCIAVDATDAAASLAAGLTGVLPRRAAILAAAAASAAAALGVIARAR